ncbi:polyamine ABC transporter substrate-binding protein [Aquibaculum arenosum]|uniref:Putrescine-binding periplasmic protein n=1 Tax=Aquibaculum arenosum TaxID=3032591 RepID=A0ABT5YRD2_9PROT|nr:polyamine ABC transporter substrate-binding protein [Fodinicurvata sp. CAU 1616]MDF2096774.1 polyamine ABC transporter substrate-binding protein [Fodinicurvata sp. CAU 1616]
MTLGLAGGLAGAQAQDTVNVYNWSDYIAEDTIANFEAETGIKVNYDVYDSNSVVEAKLLAGSSGYDVVVPTAVPYLARQIEAGIYQKLDRSKIPNWDNLDSTLLRPVGELADPGNEHAAIYMWGTNGFGYNVKMIEERMPDAPVDSYAMLFEPEVVEKFADCGIAFLDDASEVFPVLLHYLGHDPYDEDPDNLAEAEERMMELRPHIRYFHSSQYINDLANGEICVAYGWSGDVFQARDRAAEAGQGVEIEYTIPSEGTILWYDMLAIPADAPNPDGAHAFINYLLDPEVMADITDYVVYANAVPASLDHVDPEIAEDPAVFPTDEVKERLFSAEVITPRFERLRTRAWTRVRTGQ